MALYEIKCLLSLVLILLALLVKALCVESLDSKYLYLLFTGYEEKSKTRFDQANNAWKYAIRGKTVDGIPVRVVVVIEENGMLIITVMYVL